MKIFHIQRDPEVKYFLFLMARSRSQLLFQFLFESLFEGLFDLYIIARSRSQIFSFSHGEIHLILLLQII